MFFRQIFDSILGLIFPPRCAICRRIGDEIYCSSCRSDIRIIGACCERCGKPLERGGICSDCAASRPDFDLARSVAYYNGTLKIAIHKFKFRGKRALAVPLSRIMEDYLSGDPWRNILQDIDIVTAVPLHRKRHKERGYNQSEMLARAIAQKFGLNFCGDVLGKARDTRRQFDLKRAERFSNVLGAFKAKDDGSLNGRKVLLIDDILTTGATAAECAGQLKRCGADRVVVVTLSHAVEQQN